MFEGEPFKATGWGLSFLVRRDNSSLTLY